MKRKLRLEINYLFFGIFLIIGIIISTLNVLDVKNSLNFPKTFFLIYAYGQCIIEIFSFAIFALIIKKLFPKIIFTIFISLAFIFFITHIIDLILLKIMDMTFWDGLGIALDENLENFIEMLHVTGIPFFAWIIFGILALLLPFLGIAIYKLTDKISKKRNIPLYHEHFIQIMLCIPLALFIWDFKASNSIRPNIYDAYARTLPWKLTFVKPSVLKTDMKLTLKKPKNEKEMLSLIETKNLNAQKKPNIFIFVIESLRSDFITEDIAPNLSAFKKNNISFKRSLSNANATQQSWFSLFYSTYPYLWKYYSDIGWKSGATALYILKKMGYQINVFSAPELKYYSMKESLFGKNNHLCNICRLFPHYYPIEASDSDKMAISEMTNALHDDQNVYISFLDSTHFLYNWPKDFEIKFEPVSDIDAINAYTSKDNIDLIKNRYKNSIYFVDSLLGEFFATLKEKNLYDDSIIIIVGDHGEEFYEQGHLFHASHLSAEQTNVPIFIKLGKNERNIFKRDLVCHMDVFPSIFDYLLGKYEFHNVLNGETIFEKTQFGFVITTRYNASRTPYEFFIHNKDAKLTLRFKNRKNIFKKQYLEILSLKDSNDKELEIEPKQKNLKDFEKALEKYFDK